VRKYSDAVSNQPEYPNPMTKKLLFISKDSNWQLYRNEVLTKFANEYNVEVEILTTGTLKNHLKENSRLHYKIFHNFFRQSGKCSFFPGAIRYILKTKPDVVLALNNTTQLTEYLALFICKLMGIKFVWWTHGFNHHQLKNQFFQSIKKKYALSFLSKGDSIITFSPAGKDYLVKNNIRAAKIFTASNTLDTDKLKKLKKSLSVNFNKEQFLLSKFPDYKESADSVVLLFSGRLNINKKVDNAIRTVKLLNDRGVCARLLIVGDGKEKEALVTLAASLNLHDRIYFAGSVFGDELVTPYFLASDLFIMPGYIGLAIVHAFAFDLPVITEDIKIHSPEIQYLKPGVNGCFVKENNAADMADTIMAINNDHTYLNKLKRGTKESVSNEANIHKMLSNMNAALFRDRV
jgi:1,2-diacylglycerol 3-alpha-glucosyltransferase